MEKNQTLAQLFARKNAKPEAAPTLAFNSSPVAMEPTVTPIIQSYRFNSIKSMLNSVKGEQNDSNVNEFVELAQEPQSSDEFHDSESADDEIYLDHVEPDSKSNVRGNDSSILDGISITLDESQRAAVNGLARVNLGCLIGAAGTGKTTVTRFLLNTLINGDIESGIKPVRMSRVDLKAYHAKEELTEEDEHESKPEGYVPAVALVAFTGQATQVLRKNMPGTWKRNVMTIHSLLGYAPEEYTTEDGRETMRFVPTYTEENKMPWNIIIIDEASMVDTLLWHQMLDASHENCRFYFIGDLNQLTPPIGQGILGFALAQLPVFELTTIHRQADEASNKIVDTAWRVLKGQTPEFDDSKTNRNWRVIGMEIDNDVRKAYKQVIALARTLSKAKVHESVDPTQPDIYDPWRDRIMTQMNGYDSERAEALMGQAPINEALAEVFKDPEVPRIVVDYRRGKSKFAVGYRVMATKNEAPDRVDRVTNGLTGKILEIEDNPEWLGDRRLVGNEADVNFNHALMIDAAMGKAEIREEENHEEMQRMTLDELMQISKTVDVVQEERQGGPASHIIHIKFDNGAYRKYDLNAEVEQLKLAYASTTHKAQGAEMPTAIIILHHVNKRMLSRENFYTAITRARERVVILYTKHGMQLSLARQEIIGTTLKEKIRAYAQMSGQGEGAIEGFRSMNIRFPTITDFNA